MGPTYHGRSISSLKVLENKFATLARPECEPWLSEGNYYRPKNALVQRTLPPHNKVGQTTAGGGGPAVSPAHVVINCSYESRPPSVSFAFGVDNFVHQMRQDKNKNIMWCQVSSSLSFLLTTPAAGVALLSLSADASPPNPFTTLLYLFGRQFSGR